MHSIKTLTRITAIFAVTLLVSLPFMANAEDSKGFTEAQRLQVYRALAEIMPEEVDISELSGIEQVDSLYTIIKGTCRAAALHLAANQVSKGIPKTADEVSEVVVFATDICIMAFSETLGEWREYVVKQDRTDNPPI